MKINLDCVRDVLIYLEENQAYDKDMILEEIEIETLYGDLDQHRNEDILYSCRMLNEAGLIKFYTFGSDDSLYYAHIESITYKGHEFLESIKPVPVFEKVKTIAKQIGTKSLKGITQIAGNALTAYISSKLGGTGQ